MANKRLNSKKIAKQPKLKKDLALFLARYDVRIREERDASMPTLVYVLANGHRGYISWNEKEMTKLFDYRWSWLNTHRHEILEENDKKASSWAGISDTAKYRKELLEEADRLMDELLDQILVG